MTYKTILVHLDRSKRRKEQLEVALDLAEGFDAHLVGLFALEAFYVPSYAIAEAGQVVMELEQRMREDYAREAEQEFRAATAKRGVRAEWRASEVDAASALSLHARYADLVVAGQPQETAELLGAAPVHLGKTLLMNVGRPVLFVPYAGKFAKVGTRVLVAWDHGREAGRAVSDALPLLARASAVEVVRFNPPGPQDTKRLPDAEMGTWLARHGVRATLAEQTVADIKVGEQILSRAADFDANLIVMGAYAHSRVRDFVLGGATGSILESMTMPVLMSH